MKATNKPTKKATKRSTPGIRCALYMRTAANSLQAIEKQRQACRHYVSRRPGWVVAAEYVENGVPGFGLQGPMLQRLLKDVAAGKIDTVITLNASRLTRRLSDLCELLAVLSDAHVNLITAADGIGCDTAAVKPLLSLINQVKR